MAHTGYYHVVSTDSYEVQRAGKFVMVHNGVKVVDYFDRSKNLTLLGSYKSEAEAQKRAEELKA